MVVAIETVAQQLLDHGVLGLAVVALIWIGLKLWGKYQCALKLYIAEKDLRREEAIENVKAYEALCVELRTVLDTLCRSHGGRE